MDFRGRQTIVEHPERLRSLRLQTADNVGQPGKRPGIKVECYAPAWLGRQFVDTAADIESGTAEIANRKPVDVQYPRIELHFGIDRPRIHAGECRLADIDDE